MADDPAERRTDFLLEYYTVLWDNINRHIEGVWQTVTVLGVFVAAYTLVKQDLFSLELCTAIVVAVCAWYSANVYDSSLWFRRNQAIATNIERLFLRPDDLKHIQFFFREHKRGVTISHFRIALWLSRGLAVLALGYHFATAVWPVHKAGGELQPVMYLPYVAGTAYVIAEIWKYLDVRKSYKEQLHESPGVRVTLPTGTHDEATDH